MTIDKVTINTETGEVAIYWQVESEGTVIRDVIPEEHIGALRYQLTCAILGYIRIVSSKAGAAPGAIPQLAEALGAFVPDAVELRQLFPKKEQEALSHELG